jgi:hypothetical protein
VVLHDNKNGEEGLPTCRLKNVTWNSRP